METLKESQGIEHIACAPTARWILDAATRYVRRKALDAEDRVMLLDMLGLEET